MLLYKGMREFRYRDWENMQYDCVVWKVWSYYAVVSDTDDSCLVTTKLPDDTPVMQYTWKKDKNGVKIREWDIVLYGTTKHVIEYRQSCGTFALEWIKPLYELGSLMEVVWHIFNTYEHHGLFSKDTDDCRG